MGCEQSKYDSIDDLQFEIMKISKTVNQLKKKRTPADISSSYLVIFPAKLSPFCQWVQNYNKLLFTLTERIFVVFKLKINVHSQKYIKV